LNKHTVGLVALVGLLLATNAAGQEIRVTGQVRPRTEDRDPEFRTSSTGRTSMRVRLGAIATFPEAVTLRVEVQDVILLPAATGPSTFEFHQAFLDVGGLGMNGLNARVGRQEMPIGNQRLLSNNNWGQRARRFDGVRILLAQPSVRADGIAVRLPTGTSTLDRGWLFGAHGSLAQPGDSLELYALDQHERQDFESDQFTAGGHGRVTVAGTGLLGEAYLQTGTRRDQSVSAYFFGLGVARSLGPADFLAQYDHYSGDEDLEDDEVRAFDRLYGSNHSYHGYADLFTNIPVDTGERGFVDALFRTVVSLGELTDLQLDGHVFRATESESLPSDRFGEEVDLVARHRLRAAVVVEAGASYYWTGSALTAVRGLDENLAWGYLMVTAGF
jgi:hypothetical protein